MTATTDTAPTVPEANPRPTTATQKADLALDRLDALERELSTVHPDINASGVDPAAGLTETLEPILSRLAEVERLAERPWPTLELPDPEPVFEALGEKVAANLEEFQATVTSALNEAIGGLGSDVSGLAEVVDHVQSEQGSYGRALETLTNRLRELEARPTGTVELKTEPGGAGLKFLALMREVDSLAKDKTAAPEMGGYGFRSIDAAMDAVGAGMRSVGLILGTEILSHTPSVNVVSGRAWTSAFVKVRYIFTDPTDGSSHAIEMVGEGRDLGDKATSKAESMALKYALLQGLMIPFNAPESDGESTPPIEPEQHQRQQQHHQGDDQTPPSDETAPPARPGPPTTEAERKTAGYNAHKAIRGLEQVPPGERPARLDAIERQVRDWKIGDVVYLGATILDHIHAAGATL
jgi:hypothetical protein